MNEKRMTSLNTKYAAMQGFYWMSFAILTGFSSVFLLSRGFTDSQIGMVIALGNILAVFLQSPVASFADRTKKVPLSQITMMFGMLMIGFGILLLCAPRARAVSGLLFLLALTCLMIMQPLTNALGMFFVNRGFPLNFGLARGVGSLAYAGLTTALGRLVERRGEDVIPVCLIVVYVGFVLAMVLLDTGKVQKNEEHEAEDVKANAKSAAGAEKPSTLPEFVKRYPRFVLMLFGVMFLFANHNILNVYLFQIMKSLGGDSGDMGVSLAIGAVCELPTMLGFFWLIQKFRCKSLMRTSAVFFAVKTIAITAAGSIAMVHAAQTIQILAFALFTPASVYYVNERIRPQDHVKGQALVTTANAAGSVIGSLLGGQLLACCGVPVLLVGASALSVAGAVLVCLFVEN